MGDEIVFSVAAKCFAPIKEDDWNALTSGARWVDFLDAARRLLQGGTPLGAPQVPARGARLLRPLQDFLSAGEVSALFAPPSWQCKRQFEARRLRGGSPMSTPPVESLYDAEAPAADLAPGQGARLSALSGEESARCVQATAKRLGMGIPPEIAAHPDHLAFELAVAAALLSRGLTDEARAFLVDRLARLPAYRMKLIAARSEDAGDFYLALVDVLLGIWTRLCVAQALQNIAVNRQTEYENQPACI